LCSPSIDTPVTVDRRRKHEVEHKVRPIYPAIPVRMPDVFITTFFREMPVKYGVTTLLHEFSSFFVASAMGMCYNK